MPKTGGRVIVDKIVHGNSFTLGPTRFGVEAEFVDLCNPQALARAAGI